MKAGFCCLLREFHAHGPIRVVVRPSLARYRAIGVATQLRQLRRREVGHDDITAPVSGIDRRCF